VNFRLSPRFISFFSLLYFIPIFGARSPRLPSSVCREHSPALSIETNTAWRASNSVYGLWRSVGRSLVVQRCGRRNNFNVMTCDRSPPPRQSVVLVDCRPGRIAPIAAISLSDERTHARTRCVMISPPAAIALRRPLHSSECERVGYIRRFRTRAICPRSEIR